jgi:hypothetical protein
VTSNKWYMPQNIIYDQLSVHGAKAPSGLGFSH